MNKDKNITEAELEAEFVERNNNLKKTWNNLVDTIDNGVPEQQQSTVNSSSVMSSIDSSRNRPIEHGHGIFAATGSGFYNEDNDTTLGSSTRRRPSLIGEQTSRHAWTQHSFLDSRMMNSVNSDIHAMHSTDAEEFGGIAKKIDETFGCNALF